jgi:N-acetyl-anhydromuramyl-L-alanine amidase AmpD
MKRRSFLITSAIALSTLGLGASYWKNRWNYIVIHHSAGAYGDIKFLNRVHRQRQANDPIDAIPYHYIIGNGNGLGMGEIDSDWRQSYDIWGAHVSANNRDKNFRGIGICLIGNYETGKIPPRQYQSLVTLTKQLMDKYNIPLGNITGHGFVPGESTKCPGKNFPMEAFLKDLVHTQTLHS